MPVGPVIQKKLWRSPPQQKWAIKSDTLKNQLALGEVAQLVYKLHPIIEVHDVGQH